MTVERVALCWTEPGEVHGRFMDSVLQLIYADKNAVVTGERAHECVIGHTFTESGPRIGHARNSLVRSFLTKESWSEVEWLLMIDADMIFTPDALEHIFDGVRSEEGKIVRPLVGGLCFGGGSGTIIPTMYRFVDPDTNDGSAVMVVNAWAEDEIVEVDATGAAFLLMHRGVLESMKSSYPEPCPWFAESVYKTQEFGEDWTFCMRARQLGFPIYVDTRVKIGHMKPVNLNEEMYRTGSAGLKSISAFADTQRPRVGREITRASEVPPVILRAAVLNRQARRAHLQKSGKRS
ncbi:MAG TPA: hypothetical protein VG246_13225 [Acidimicrobiales bacterium]|nr:hypothetical protein [Acidimicrobiales bacterium]